MKLNGHLNLGVVTLWKTPGFEINDLGYFTAGRQGSCQLSWVGYSSGNPKGIYRRFNINGDVWSFFNLAGFMLETDLEGNVSMTFKNYWNVPRLRQYWNRLPMMQLCSGWTTMKHPKSSCHAGFSTDNGRSLYLSFT